MVREGHSTTMIYCKINILIKLILFLFNNGGKGGALSF